METTFIFEIFLLLFRQPCVQFGLQSTRPLKDYPCNKKQFQTVSQNEICKSVFESVFKKATIVAMRDIRTVPLDRSFHFLLNA